MTPHSTLTPSALAGLEERLRGAARTKLSSAQITMLALHRETTRQKPRRKKYDGTYHREILFPSNPTAMSLKKRGLLDWRGFDGTPGGWFITKAGVRALAAQQGERG